MKNAHPTGDQNTGSPSGFTPSSGPEKAAAFDSPLTRFFPACSLLPILPLGAKRKHKILIVDETAIIAGGLVVTCNSLGHHGTFATSIEEALFLVQQQAFDLVMTEYRFSSGNGFVLINQLRQLKLEMPVIVMTDNPKNVESIQPTLLKISKVLIKPFSRTALETALYESLV